MVGPISSSQGLSLLSTIATPAGTAASAGFGPAFLPGALGLRGAAAGAAYDAGGRPLLPPETTAAGRERREALEAAAALLDAGDTTGMRATLEPVLRKYPGDPASAYLVGLSYLKDGDDVRAEEYLGRAASASGNARVAGDLRAAQTLRRGPAAALSEIRRLLVQRGTAAEGLRLATYFLERNPDNIEVRVEVSRFYERRGNLPSAGLVLREAIDRVGADRASSLVSYLEDFARRHSNDAGAFDLLAQGYVKAGRLSDAERAFEAALRLSEEGTLFQLDLKADFANVYAQIGRERQAAGLDLEARRAFERALELDPSDSHRADLSDYQRAAGERALRQGRLRAALAAFDAARLKLPAIDPTSQRKERLIERYEQLAARLTASGDRKVAVSARFGAYILDPGNDTRKRALADANDFYGLDRMNQHDYQAAIRAFRAALQLYPDDENYLAHLSEAQSYL